MAPTREMIPPGKDPFARSPGEEPGVNTHGFPQGPVDGEEVPLDTSPKPAPSGSQTTQGVELNLVGNFPKPASWDPATEKAQIKADKWFPHVLDFKAVAEGKSGKGTSKTITDASDFLLKIMQVKGTISRRNFFSHAMTGLIAMEGTVASDGSSVTLGPSGSDGKWTQIISGRAGAIMDPYAATWGSFGENGGSVSITVNNTTITLDAVRAKFAADAVIWLYLCNGATDPMLFQEVANTFQVTVKGFTKELLYCAPVNFPTSREHKVAPLTTAVKVDSCANGNTDFKALDSNSNVKTASPKKPP